MTIPHMSDEYRAAKRNIELILFLQWLRDRKA